MALPDFNMRGLLEAGAIGRPTTFRAREGHSGPHAAHFWDARLAGGGALLDMASHGAEAARRLFGKDVRVRDVFAWAYERSCAQYRVVRESVPQPDPLRLRYRGQLHELVRATVSADEAPQVHRLRARGAALGVAAVDLDGFTERAVAELLNLHEGSASRYQLRPSDVSAWRERVQTKAP